MVMVDTARVLFCVTVCSGPALKKQEQALLMPSAIGWHSLHLLSDSSRRATAAAVGDGAWIVMRSPAED